MKTSIINGSEVSSLPVAIQFSNIVEGDLSPYMTYCTPASRHAEVANGPVYPSYHYVLRDKFMNYEVVSELSQIQIPMRPDFVLKITMDGAA
ncbi:hypothetical protein [Klebsiella pneumoniae]|uniref:hypothetical protein n=1 Tax=Klebsiella pneumoniae TaxID=573 RepID=UPI003CF4BA61